MRSILFAAVLAVSAAGAVAAAPQPARAEAPHGAALDALADRMFGLMQQGKTKEAMVSVFSPDVVESKRADFDNLANQTDAALRYYGEVLGWELASETAYSPSVVYRYYVLRTKLGPLFYRIQFYRAAAGWTVTYLVFADDPTKLPS